MLKIYFSTDCRELLKDKLYSVINVFGLATGIAIEIAIHHDQTYYQP